jgi:DNA adenine methylase
LDQNDEDIQLNGPAKIPHPIPYQGSKRQIAAQILPFFPVKSRRLVEPFVGSAAISIAAASKGLADRFWLNDAHQPLVELWSRILETPTELVNEYESLWNKQIGQERTFYNEVRARFNKTHQPADFLYLLARSVKAVIRYNSSGEFNNTPDNRRKGARPTEMRRRVDGAAELLGGRTKVTCKDYKSVLKQCRETDLIYMDPPYQGVCKERDQRYGAKITHEEFCDELNKLEKKKYKFIVSYDGRTGTKNHGERIPDSLGLKHLEIKAGRSSQATLLGRDCVTYESLYLSSSIVENVDFSAHSNVRRLTLI